MQLQRGVWLLLGLLLSVRVSEALDPDRLLTQYAHHEWRAPEAIPHDDVSSILQTRDGYLWVGTVEGLARFDGVRSVVFDKSNTAAFTNNWIKALLEDHKGRLWIGTFGGGLLCREGGRFVRWGPKEGFSQDLVLSLLEDREGRIWAGTSAGVLRLAEGAFTRPPGLEAISGTRVRALLQDHGGTIWIGADDGLYKWTGTALSRLDRADGLPDERIMALAEDRESLWVATERGGIARISGRQITPLTRAQGLAHERIWSLAVDRDHNLWIGSDGGGLQRLSGGRLSSISTRNGLVNDFVWALREDDQGDLWIGTNGGGLVRFEDGRVVPFSTREGLPSDFVWAVRRTRDGSLWIGTEDAGLARMRDGSVQRVTTRDGLSSNQAKVLLESKDGTLWIGGDGGLDRWQRDRVTPSVPRVGGRINALAEGNDGTLWIATDRAGLLSIRPGSTQAPRQAIGLPAVEVTALLAATDGAIWAGTVSGIARLAGDQVTTFGVGDGLPSSYVTSLFEEPQGVVWAGTRGGLVHIEAGRLQSVTQRQGLFDDAIMLALPAGDGTLWMGGNRGLFRVSRKDVEEVMAGHGATIQALVLGRDDGLRSVEINGAGSSGWKDPDGILWFATQGGVARVDPARLVRPSRVPPVLIEGISADERLLEGTLPRVPADTRRLSFQFTAIDLRSPSRVRFAWRLEGFDPTWVDGGNARRAEYTNLPHGRYRFRVKAGTDANVWNEEGASVQFEIEPRLHETVAFRVLVVLFFVLAGPAFYLVRVRHLNRQKAHLEGLVAAATAELKTANSRLAQLSREDPLTSVWNRRHLDEALQEEWRRAARQGTSLTFMLLDVDFFKEYNDRHGHPAGDACLKAIAAALTARHRRAGDLVARYGGEEFALLVPALSEAEAASAAEEVRRDIERLGIPHHGSIVAQVVTVSVGVAWSEAKAEGSPAELLAAADRALYRAKEAGRNRVEGG